MTNLILPVRRAVAGAALFALAALGACAGETAPSADVASAPVVAHDVHSFAKPEQARVTHLDLDLTADFAAKQLAGTAALDLDVAPGASEVVLDTRDLVIESVTDSAGAPLEYALGAADPNLGQPLTVQLPASTERIVVHYRTSPDAAALQWLAPAQTAGKQHPYLFSQGQAILTRTWIPTQDSPGVRQTYSARITVPAGLKAVMSAEMLTPAGEAAEGDAKSFRFRLDQPVPPYLIALAVGDIDFRPLGQRTGVYAEPSVIEKAAHELGDLEEMVAAAESLYGPYRWGRYDVLVLPPSFPFGGMENPRLTFATPTILAGDRSLVSLVAHELAHSWSGNLVTNATWSDFWLNEGFTTYFENRIMEAMYGADRAAMLDHLDRQGLLAEMKEFGAGSPETVLHIDLTGRDPDDGMTSIPYDKGAAFLRMLEHTFGRERWDAYLRGYFDRYAFKPMTSEAFLADLRGHLVQGDSALDQKLQLDAWVYEPGLPSNATEPHSDAFRKVEQQAAAFVDGTPAAQLATGEWVTQEWQHFLGALPEKLSAAQLADLDRTFKLSEQGNSEVLFAWLRIAIRNQYEPAMPALARFLTEQGRRKFLVPLYQDLMAQGEWGQQRARKIYQQARPLYHPVSVASVDPVVKWDGR